MCVLYLSVDIVSLFDALINCCVVVRSVSFDFSLCRAPIHRRHPGSMALFLEYATDLVPKPRGPVLATAWTQSFSGFHIALAYERCVHGLDGVCTM